jgi:hypothetical protein
MTPEPKARKGTAPTSTDNLTVDPNTPSWMTPKTKKNDAAVPKSGNGAVDGEVQDRKGARVARAPGVEYRTHNDVGCFWPCVVYTLYVAILSTISMLLACSLLQPCPTENMRMDRCIALVLQLIVAALSYYDYKTDCKFNLRCIWSCLFVVASISMLIMALVDGLDVHLEAKIRNCHDVKIDPTMTPIGEAFLCLAWGKMLMIIQLNQGVRDPEARPTPMAVAASPKTPSAL